MVVLLMYYCVLVVELFVDVEHQTDKNGEN